MHEQQAEPECRLRCFLQEMGLHVIVSEADPVCTVLLGICVEDGLARAYILSSG